MSVVATIELSSDFPSSFHSNVVKEIVRKVKSQALKIQKNVTAEIRDTVRSRLITSDEYGSIVAGRLRGELGVPESSARITEIVETWVNGISTTVKTGSSPFLLIDIGMIQSDYGDVLGLDAETYTYTSARGGGEIPWLEWLLLEGPRRIINKYEFSSNVRRRSRTGMGIMIQKSRGFWQVPSDMSGTSTDNFATRALDKIEDDIDAIIEKILRSTLK